MKNLKGMILAIALLLSLGMNTSYAKCIAYDEAGGEVTALDKIPLHGTWSYIIYSTDYRYATELNGYMVFYKGLHSSRNSYAIQTIERMVESPTVDESLENDYEISSGGADWGAYIPAISDADSILHYLTNRKLTIANESVIGRNIRFMDMDLCKFEYRGSTKYYFSLNMVNLAGAQGYDRVVFTKISDEPKPSYTSSVLSESYLRLNKYTEITIRQ